MVVHEKLDFRGSILMWGIILLEAPTLILLSTLYLTGHLGEDGWIVLLVVFGIMSAVFFLILSISVEIRADEKGLSYRNPPFFSNWKKIPLSDIRSANVTKSGGLLDYGGVGVRVSRKGTAYIFFSDHVLEINRNSTDKKLVFSTHRHQDFLRLIDLWAQEQDKS
ncbi:hypothetical protein ADIS_2366 [Lunatimonas lonarensis]|uniref:Bacterial Pleckstrin homology domain-containing protein n=1 Tax=Lunatimonas lonarensis TaxID=1232681 RepID=R7ZSN7_9BACT|nr:hypothetical protein [Lunatimonas lonarensis]EON77156.1 hypothetical protein ADIS_2366 [Lunatimonas lonarensis]